MISEESSRTESDLKSLEYPPTTPHLNPFGLYIHSSATDGRGVYASTSIPPGTLVEISPVLLFDKDEYSAHGKYTALDHYTFIWRDQRKGGQKAFALALGLGSLFNHSSSPNVSFSLDHSTMSIRYTTVRRISPGEQLYISYGREEDMWWHAARTRQGERSASSDLEFEEDPLKAIDI